jgi:hypothetical protein
MNPLSDSLMTTKGRFSCVIPFLDLLSPIWARSLVVGHEVEWSTVVYVCHKLFNLCVDVHSFFLAVLVTIACLFLVLLFARVD